MAAHKKTVYDFAEADDEQVPNKRGRRTTQRKNRAKPAPFPRLRVQPVERRKKMYTIRIKTPVGLAARAMQCGNGDVDRCEHTDAVDMNANVDCLCWWSPDEAVKLKQTFQRIRDDANQAVDLL